MDLKTALKIFGLESLDGQNQESLKQVYRKLAKQKHPDKQGGTNESFVELRQGYLFLYAILATQEDSNDSNLVVSGNKHLKTLTKEEILNKYYTDTKDLQLKLDEYEEHISKQNQALDEVKDTVESVISEFENKKEELRKELEVEISILEKSFKSNPFKRILFFLPSLSEDEFWEKYHSKVEEYTQKDAQTDILFLKKILSVYGDGLNQISQTLIKKIYDQQKNQKS
jgi:hypothetical protein